MESPRETFLQPRASPGEPRFCRAASGAGGVVVLVVLVVAVTVAP